MRRFLYSLYLLGLLYCVSVTALCQVRTLVPSGSFSTAFADGSRLVHLTGVTGTLYALLRSKTGAELLRFSYDGKLLERSPVDRRTTHFVVDSDGAVIAIRRHEQSAIITGPLFSRTKLPSERTLPFLADRLGLLGRQLVVISDLFADIDGTRVQLGPSPFTAIPLPDGSIALVDRRQPSLRVLNSGGTLSQRTPLTAPELKQFQTSDFELSVIDAATIDDQLLVAASPYNPLEGAKILRFSSRGQLKESLRVAMPEFPELAGSAGGKMSVSRIATVGTRLFLASTTPSALRFVYCDLK